MKEDEHNVSKEDIVNYYIEYIKGKSKKINWKKVGKIALGVIIVGGVVYVSYRCGKKTGFNLGWIKGEVTGYVSGWNECKSSDFIARKMKTEFNRGFSAGSEEAKKIIIDQLSNLAEDSKFVQFLYDRYGITHVGKTIFRRMR